MGWETRKGRRYYYRKKRVGGRVRSIYCGARPGPEMCSTTEDMPGLRHHKKEPVEPEMTVQSCSTTGDMADMRHFKKESVEPGHTAPADCADIRTVKKEPAPAEPDTVEARVERLARYLEEMKRRLGKEEMERRFGKV